MNFYFIIINLETKSTSIQFWRGEDPLLFCTDFKGWALSDIFDKTQAGNSEEVSLEPNLTEQQT